MTWTNWHRILRCSLIAVVLCMCFLANSTLADNGLSRPSFTRDICTPTYVWSNDAPPKAIVVGFHGGCLHGRAFQSLATKLAKRDLMFVSFDMRGYGRWYRCNYGTPADATFNYRRTFGDATVLLNCLKATYPNTPIYLLGESLGANAAVVAAKGLCNLTDGLILVSPAFGIRLFFSPWMIYDIAHAMVKPKSPINMRHYLNTRLASKPQIIQEHLYDPLERDLQTPKELWQSNAINRRGHRYMTRLSRNLPLLIVAGKNDRLCNVQATKRVFDSIPLLDKQMVLLNNTGHLIVETRYIDNVVTETLANWICTRAQTRGQMQARTSRPRDTVVRTLTPQG